MNDVRFFSKYKMYRILAPSVRSGYITFTDGELVTADQEVIRILMDHFARAPWEVWLDPEQGRVVCPVCFKPLKDEFGLKGHMRSHETRPAAEGPSQEEPV